jgi:hypothetical protein
MRMPICPASAAMDEQQASILPVAPVAATAANCLRFMCLSTMFRSLSAIVISSDADRSVVHRRRQRQHENL